MKMKRLIAALLVSAITIGAFASCKADDKGTDSKPESTGTSQTETEKGDATKLVYYTIGNPDNDLKLVETELNKLLKEKINVEIEYNKIAWGDYGTRLSAIVNSGGDFDIAFATGPDQGNYLGNAEKGAWLALDDYLENEGKEMYDAINPLYWEGMKVNGSIYGVPTHKEIAVPEMWMYPKELVEKYNIDITKLTTLESLEPVLKQIKENEPDYIPMEIDKISHNFFAIDGYEWVINRDIPLMIKSTDTGVEVVNIFETDIAKDTLKTLRKYYEAGYINEDAAVKENQGLEKDKKVFWKQSSGGPYSEVSWSSDRNYELVAHQVTEAVVTTESVRGGVMVVNANSKNKEAAIKFLNLLNTDPDVRNLINYGVEGTHYEMVNGQVQKLNEDSPTYQGVQYTQGNWFILDTMVGEPLEKWDEFQKFNDAAVQSQALGFSPDTSKIESKIAAITNVSQKYYSGLMTGTVDPETELPKFLAELEAAGINELKEELQNQINEWKAAKS